MFGIKLRVLLSLVSLNSLSAGLTYRFIFDLSDSAPSVLFSVYNQDGDFACYKDLPDDFDRSQQDKNTPINNIKVQPLDRVLRLLKNLNHYFLQPTVEDNLAITLYYHRLSGESGADFVKRENLFISSRDLRNKQPGWVTDRDDYDPTIYEPTYDDVIGYSYIPFKPSENGPNVLAYVMNVVTQFQSGGLRAVHPYVNRVRVEELSDKKISYIFVLDIGSGRFYLKIQDQDFKIVPFNEVETRFQRFIGKLNETLSLQDAAELLKDVRANLAELRPESEIRITLYYPPLEDKGVSSAREFYVLDGQDLQLNPRHTGWMKAAGTEQFTTLKGGWAECVSFIPSTPAFFQDGKNNVLDYVLQVLQNPQFYFFNKHPRGGMYLGKADKTGPLALKPVLSQARVEVLPAVRSEAHYVQPTSIPHADQAPNAPANVLPVMPNNDHLVVDSPASSSWQNVILATLGACGLVAVFHTFKKYWEQSSQKPKTASVRQKKGRSSASRPSAKGK